MNSMSDFADRFEREGGPVPQVKPEHLAAMWKLERDANEQFRSAGTSGLGVLAGYGIDVEALSQTEGGVLAVQLRATLLQSLAERRVVNDYVQGEQVDERVIRAVASFPFDKEGLAEAFIQLQLKKLPPEQSSQLRSSLIAEGYNPEEPKVDSKFLEWMRTQQ